LKRHWRGRIKGIDIEEGLHGSCKDEGQQMRDRCDHLWTYAGVSCCGYRLCCTRLGCQRATLVKRVQGNPKVGDPVRLSEDGELAVRIESRVEGFEGAQTLTAKNSRR
jgi:hypothetical protein